MKIVCRPAARAAAPGRSSRACLGLLLLTSIFTLGFSGRASAQIVEAVGSRALGMGGAFVAVANDSTATWWNPAGVPTLIFDTSLARAITDSSREVPARRDRVSWLTFALPFGGFGYYRMEITEIGTPGSTDPEAVIRQEEQGPVQLRTLEVRQYGVTLAHTVVQGVHVASTLKYLRGTMRGGIDVTSMPVDDALDLGEDLEGGDADGTFDFDLGVMAVAGALRLGAVVRNVREPVFHLGDTVVGMQLPRQVRLGVAFDGDAIKVTPLTISFDADVQRYPTVSGDRRVIAFGAEQWLLGHRVAVRGGGRFNTVGAEDRAATVGVSVALRSRVYLDGHLVRGGTADDRGWGIAARVSY